MQEERGATCSPQTHLQSPPALPLQRPPALLPITRLPPRPTDSPEIRRGEAREGMRPPPR